MANLIEDRIRTCEFAALEEPRLMRLRNRLLAIQSTIPSWEEFEADSGRFDLRVMTETFADDLEEFEMAVSEATLDALLGQIDVRGRATVEGAVSQPHRGSTLPVASGCAFGIHSFGRTLATGEAEIASRGFFDERDRPPLAFFLETVRQPSLRRDEGAGVGVLFFVPEVFVARARAGFAACPSGALTLIDENQTALYAQLASLMECSSLDSHGEA